MDTAPSLHLSGSMGDNLMGMTSLLYQEKGSDRVPQPGTHNGLQNCMNAKVKVSLSGGRLGTDKAGCRRGVWLKRRCPDASGHLDKPGCPKIGYLRVGTRELAAHSQPGPLAVPENRTGDCAGLLTRPEEEGRD